MADFGGAPAPKLRLLKRIPRNSDAGTYDPTVMRANRPPVRNAAPVQPEWNSDVELLRTDADESNALFNKPSVPLPRRQHPLRKPPALPEWNFDTSTPLAAEEDSNQQVPSAQNQSIEGRVSSAPRRVAPSSSVETSLAARKRDVGTEGYQPASSHQQRLPASRTVDRGRVAPSPGKRIHLEDEALLLEAVPRKWAPSRHHLAELLEGIGCSTIGGFRQLVKETALEKVVDTVLAADASCASPGGIRNRSEAKTCIEDFIRLVQSDGSSAPAKTTMREVAPSAGTDSELCAPRCAGGGGVADEATFGKNGCPKCGRDVTGRALVMHLKTCRAQPKQAESPSELCHPGPNPRPTSPPLPAQRNMSGDAIYHPGAHSATPLVDVHVAKAEELVSHHLDVTPSALNGVLGVAGIEVPEDTLEEPLLPCPHCGRTFREKVLQRHVGTCLSVSKPRKQFNALQHALPVEAIKLHKQAEKQSAKAEKQSAKVVDNEAIKPSAPNWKAKSEAFRNAIKEGRAVSQCIKQGKPVSQLPPSKPTAPELDDRIQCKHCGRKFGEQQAARHIPICPMKGRGKGKR